MSFSKMSLTILREYTGSIRWYSSLLLSWRTYAFAELNITRCSNSLDHTICISTKNCLPRLSLHLTSTILNFRSGFSGTSSGERYSIDSISSPLLRGRRALSRLITRSGCSPNTFLKVRSAFGSRYLFVIVIQFLCKYTHYFWNDNRKVLNSGCI